MRLLLTSSGISNPSISDALVELLGKPIAESSALFVPTAIYPFPGGAGMAWQAICGRAQSPLCELGWKSLGVLELTALPTIRAETEQPDRLGDVGHGSRRVSRLDQALTHYEVGKYRQHEQGQIRDAGNSSGTSAGVAGGPGRRLWA